VTSGLIKYQYSAIQDGVSQMKNANTNIDQKCTDLTNQVKTLLGDFMGASSQSYDTSANKIKTNLTTSNERLNQLSVKVNTGANNMQSTDSREAGRFQ
jgi:WXG100 family type VII secretion target